jgi:hypothetical protein
VPRKPQTTELPDSFDPLLRAAVDVSDVPPGWLPAAGALAEGAVLGSGRFRIARPIGHGGMGAVYEAEDHDSGARVALKVLNRLEPKAVKRFKDEFRTLADTIHPHLVRLHDLFVEEGTWFFTMDLIEGVTLSAHLERVGPPGSTEREREIRRLLSQLADGVAAIHATSHLHRDLKPANMLVSGAGRLTIVDFGLVAALPEASGEYPLPVVGTANYMAPEQARGEPATTASDWYAVGTILHEALTGRTPYAGSASEVLRQKRSGGELRLFEEKGPWPEDLVELCRELLSPDPEARWRVELMKRLAGGEVTAHSVVVREPSFAGRTRELLALHKALSRAAGGELVVCRIVGPPGMGKTALVREFLQRASATNSKALSGRCYERETTPFKLLEGLVDSLSSAVARHASWSCSTLLPLARLFLGLSREWPAELAGDPSASTGPELRSRAVAAFRSGLAALARTGTVIVHIDDVQWCDADGVGLLDEILEAPAPALLLLLTARDDEPTDALRALWSAGFWTRAGVVELRVGPLEHGDLVEIVRDVTGDDPTLDAGVIALECEGNPYFATEVARHALERRFSGKAVMSVAPTLGDTILSRYRSLPDGARRVLDALAISDGPRSVHLLKKATGVDDLQRAVAVLRASTFVRTRAQRSTTLVEPYHDRVREELHRSLSDSERRALHLASARAFEALSPGACEQLLHHYEGAGEPPLAARYARQSAERAARAHAFEQAATLYGRALRLAPWEPDDERLLHERHADALAMCGHGAEAAESYDRAARMAGHAHRVRLEMLAGSQLLCSGNVTRGLEQLFRNIGCAGVHMAHGSDATVLLLEYTTTALREAASLSYRDEEAADPERLLRVDACWWAVKGVASTIHDAVPFLASAHLLEAVRAGEPARIARGAYFQAIYSAAPQWESMAPLLRGLMRLGDEAAARAPSPTVRFWREYSLMWQSHLAFDIDGIGVHAPLAREHASAAGGGLETELALLSIVESQVHIARFEDAAELGYCEDWKRDALRRGDRNILAWASICDCSWWITDTPEAYRAELLDLLQELLARSDDSQVLVWSVHANLAWVERYLGLTADALARTTLVLERMRKTGSWFVPRQRVIYDMEYVASAIASAEAGGPEVSAEVRSVLDEFPRQACGMIHLYRAGLAHLSGDRHETMRLLELAEAEPGKERTRTVVMGARIARGRLTGDRRVVEEELARSRGVGCANPERLFDSWWPGLRPRARVVS